MKEQPEYVLWWVIRIGKDSETYPGEKIERKKKGGGAKGWYQGKGEEISKCTNGQSDNIMKSS